MMNIRARAHIRLNGQAEVMAFVQGLSRYEDSFSIESRSGLHRVNAKSVIGVMYTMFDFPDEMYLVNDTRDGVIPAFVDQFRMPAYEKSLSVWGQAFVVKGRAAGGCVPSRCSRTPAGAPAHTCRM